MRADQLDLACVGCGVEHPGRHCDMQDALPELLPPVEGHVASVVSLDPPTLQCRSCGLLESAATWGMKPTQPIMTVVVCSQIHFHSKPWTSGHADNPPLCRECRVGRGCTCDWCQFERGGRR